MQIKCIFILLGGHAINQSISQSINQSINQSCKVCRLYARCGNKPALDLSCPFYHRVWIHRTEKIKWRNVREKKVNNSKKEIRRPKFKGEEEMKSRILLKKEEKLSVLK
jgi:hypothetical protein